MDERQSSLWQDLNRGQTTMMRAGHAYEARRPASGGLWNPAGLAKARLLATTLVGLPIALVIIRLLAASLGH